MSEENKELVKRFYHEMVNKQNLGLIEELLAPNYSEHLNPSGSGHEGFKQFVDRIASAFPDLQVTVEDLIAEGDKVVARVTIDATHMGTFLGRIPATGKRVSYGGIDIF